MRPVAEAVGVIVRPDDQARPDDKRRVAEGFFDDPLAGRLPRAVDLRVRVGLLPLGQLRHHRAFHRRHAWSAYTEMLEMN